MSKVKKLASILLVSCFIMILSPAVSYGFGSAGGNSNSVDATTSAAPAVPPENPNTGNSSNFGGGYGSTGPVGGGSSGNGYGGSVSGIHGGDLYNNMFSLDR